MKKGDLKRSSILETAERLFFDKGYEQTSIQDILDMLSMSKGGFYHHFASKEAILSEICENRVVASLSQMKWELFGEQRGAVAKLNLILRKVNLFERENTAFVALLLKVGYVDGDVRIRDRIRSVVTAQLAPHLNDVIAEGIKSGELFARSPGQIGAIVLGMVADTDDCACRILAKNADSPECVIEIAERLNACRDAVETLLSAPFGSIELFNPSELVMRYRDAAKELLKLEGKYK